jgi:hypothetical protein
MPWIIPKPEQLEHRETVGVGPDQTNKGECAALAQGLGKGVPQVRYWSRGAQVKGQLGLIPGTVIAIFNSNGDYLGQKNHPHKHGTAHTALYLGQDTQGIWVVHQDTGHPHIKRTFIRFGGRSAVSREGNTPEDDADNYHVVELKSPGRVPMRPRR